MTEKIAIWGAGRFGRYVYDQLKDRQGLDISCFLDRNLNLTGSKIDGIDIIVPEHLQADGEMDVDYVLVSFLGGIGIYDQLLEFRKTKFGIVKDRVFKNKLELKDKLMEDSNIFWIVDSGKPLYKSMETHVVDYCNLNCKGCSHFSNLCHAGDIVPFNTYCRDLEQIARKVNLFCFSILGGEALLSDKILDYIRVSRQILPYADILLITNGLLLPAQKEEFFISCAENNIAIEVSEYPPTSRMRDQIIRVLNQYGVMYHIRDGINQFMKNIDLSGKADKYNAMKSCLQDGCNFLRNGKLYKCPFEALGNKFFEHFQLNICLQGGVDIYDEGQNWKELVYSLEKEPVDACRYCGKGEWFAWENSASPTVDEWIVGIG